ncbi:hypothetical protein LTR66_016433 [Elasticomyces elasticus]|nr:hypothetical protein LTR66_016433 [Elasticomyces elasticus]
MFTPEPLPAAYCPPVDDIKEESSSEEFSSKVFPPGAFPPENCLPAKREPMDSSTECVRNSIQDDDLSWDEFTESDYQSGIQEIKDQLEDLGQQRLSQTKRLQAIEAKIEDLFTEKEITAQLWNTPREPILHSWSGKRPSSKVDCRLALYTHRGNIRADIRAIDAMRFIDGEVFQDWQDAFEDRYGVPWKECMETNCLRNVSWEGVQVFNMRAYVSHRFQGPRDEIMRICDSWIVRWRLDHKFPVPAVPYARLCRLYYAM